MTDRWVETDARDVKKRVKMIDVARRASVSLTTVSLVLNDIPGVRIADATRQHVIDTARLLGYSRGPTLQDLDESAVQIVGVVINEISSAYPIDIIDGLHLAARANSAQLAIFVTDGVVEREAEALRSIRRLGARSVIYANTFTAGIHPTEDLQAFRHVFVNCFREDGGGTAVIPGERAAGFAAAQYLARTGCRRLATITGDSWHSSTQRRLGGFRRGAKQAGIGLDEAYVKYGDWQHRRGREAMLELLALDEPPDGVFCHNDMLARGALAAAAEMGLKTPDDISILGFDDREFAGDLGLSTMILPHAAMAERAMAILLGGKALEGTSTISIRCRLVSRSTTR
jgi:LacI family transcriptional regulator